MLNIAIITLLISMAIVLVRAIRFPTMYDCILVANTFGTKTVVLIVLMALLMDNMMFLDIALIYALINFVATIGYLKYFKYSTLGKE